MKKDFKLGVKDRPKLGTLLFLSLQHVTAMFSATILIPMIVGIPTSIALFTSGVGTLIYILLTKASVPVYLGSSGAFVASMLAAKAAMGGGVEASQTGLILVGLSYVIVSFVINKTGKDWLGKLLPPIIIGPMIMIIGLSLAPWAIEQSGFVSGGNIKNMIVAVVTIAITVFFIVKGKGFFSVVPFLMGILGGYLLASVLGIVQFSEIAKASVVQLPAFNIWGLHYSPNFGPAALAMIPVIIVSISEHIGDHTVLGKICGKDFLKDPGVDKTLMGDGVATMVSAFFGGPANTTYGENTAVIGITKIASVWVTGGAAVIAILLSFSGTVTAIITSIPSAVLGGVSLILYGVIASNGLKVMIEANVNLGKQRNMVIASIMLIIGLGGAIIPLGTVAELSGTALAGIVGVLLNWILPE